MCPNSSWELALETSKKTSTGKLWFRGRKSSPWGGIPSWFCWDFTFCIYLLDPRNGLFSTGDSIAISLQVQGRPTKVRIEGWMSLAFPWGLIHPKSWLLFGPWKPTSRGSALFLPKQRKLPSTWDFLPASCGQSSPSALWGCMVLFKLPGVVLIFQMYSHLC